MNNNKTIKNLLKKEKEVIGPFVRVQDPSVIEILGYGGFDFGVIDLEHGPLSIFQVENLVRAAKISGLTPIVRVSENSPTNIQRALDAGAEGVQVPQINNAEMAEKAVSASKFYPEGERGVCGFTRSAKYSHISKEQYFNNANKEILVILQVEGLEGVKNIDEILEIEGIDVLFVGPYDLSQSLGITGQVEHEDVIKNLEIISEKCKKKNISMGAFADNFRSMERFKKLGMQYLNFGIDTGIFYEYTKNIVKELKKL